MSTASHHRRVRLQRLQFIRLNAPVKSGRQAAGPRALRPERLQWLTTPAENRQAFRLEAHASNPCGAGQKHHCDARRQKHAGSGHRAIWGPGRSAACAINAASFGPCHSRCQRRRSSTGLLRQRSRASAHLPLPTLKILTGLEAKAGTSPPFSFCRSRAPP